MPFLARKQNNDDDDKHSDNDINNNSSSNNRFDVNVLRVSYLCAIFYVLVMGNVTAKE